MTTNNSPPTVSRARRLPSFLWLVAMLLAAVVVSGNSMQARCPEKAAVATAAAVSATQAAPGRLVPASATTGLDLEVRILNVRIGFPWLKSLPVTPGRRIVVSLWETDSDR